MKKFNILLFILICFSGFSQHKFMIDTTLIKDNSILIGRCPHFDKSKTFCDKNFYINDSKVIKELIKSIELGAEKNSSIADPGFDISLINNFKEEERVLVNMFDKSILNYGHSYNIDLDKILELNKKYPFAYNFEKVVFKSKEEYQKYLMQQKQNAKFLFDYSPQFKFEGSFEMEFPKNEEYKSPKAISEIVSPEIEKYVKKNEYSFSYVLNEKNLKNREQFTMTVRGSYELFKKLKLKEIKNINWKPTEETGMFFYKEN